MLRTNVCYLRAQSCVAFLGKIMANSAAVHRFGRLSQKKSSSAASFGDNLFSGSNVSKPSIRFKKAGMHLRKVLISIKLKRKKKDEDDDNGG